MASRFRNVLNRSPAIASLVLILSAMVFTGSAIFSVVQRSKTDDQICAAVKGVRDDLVTSIRKIESRAMSNAKTQAEKDAIKQAYEQDLVAGIEDPHCP